MTSDLSTRHTRRGLKVLRWAGWALLVALVMVQCWAIYAPDAPATPTFPLEDKLVHAALFGLPAFLSYAAGLRPRLVVTLLAVHAPVSELLQHLALPNRTGDVWDAVADLVGITLGVALAWAARRLVGNDPTRW